MRILVAGDRSFASIGLVEILMGWDHSVTCFSRGPLRRSGKKVQGPVCEIDRNPELSGSFDAVVNYLLLKDQPIGPNIEYIDALLRFCEDHSVAHLVHISSVSVYRSGTDVIDESTELETHPERKGPYGSLKVATDRRLLAQKPRDLRLSLVRPGFVLGSGLGNPIVGNAVRLPDNTLLAVGNARRQFPVVSRVVLNDIVKRVLESPPADEVEVVLAVAPNSPDLHAYLAACVGELGSGLKLRRYPKVAWRCAAIGGQILATALGQGQRNPYHKIASRLDEPRFLPANTEARLGRSLSFDWREELRSAMAGQRPNFLLPYLPKNRGRTSLKHVTVLGFGRVVQSLHLPALAKLAFKGDLDAFDLRGFEAAGVTVRKAAAGCSTDSDLLIVATPGPTHAETIQLLGTARGPVLVEKPLCYSRSELDRWTEYDQGRDDPIVVCHNYRLKRNVTRMLRVLQRHNPGELRHVTLQFQSPPVAYESSAWLRRERVARTLLMDYGIHFLDLACMFSTDGWQADHVRYSLDGAGNTGMVEGRLSSDAYSVSFLLAQGFGPRRAKLLYNFQNYTCSLGFFPDTFVPFLSNDNAAHHLMAAGVSARATLRKVVDKLAGRNSDESHADLMAALASGDSDSYGHLTVSKVRAFYEVVFDIGEIVYSARPARRPVAAVE
ncbi:MAG: NAD-dependent epimerase/dehydratase family protein [Planctomycetota bacterium]